MLAVREQVKAYLREHSRERPARMAKLIELIRSDPDEVAAWLCDLWDRSGDAKNADHPEFCTCEECVPELYYG